MRGFVYSTCEDRVPGFRGYAQRLELARAVAQTRATGLTPPAPPFGLGANRAMDRVVEALAECSPAAVLDAMVETAGRNLLAFDIGFAERSDVTVSRSVGWLDLTHAVTFAAALRELAGRHPELWAPGLLQLACFTGRMQPFLAEGADTSAWRVDDPEAFFEAAIERLFDHGQRTPIIACHLLKTTLAARELAPVLGSAARRADGGRAALPRVTLQTEARAANDATVALAGRPRLQLVTARGGGRLRELLVPPAARVRSRVGG